LGHKVTGLKFFIVFDERYGGWVAKAKPFFRLDKYYKKKEWFFMFIVPRKLKNIIMALAILTAMQVLSAQCSFALSAEIKNVTKINRMGSYIISINYETHEAWADSLLFKIHCKFNEEEFTFTSAVLNNIPQGWHKTEIGISDVMKKRYGSIREYKIELYCKGILIDTKSGY